MLSIHHSSAFNNIATPKLVIKLLPLGFTTTCQWRLSNQRASNCQAGRTNIFHISVLSEEVWGKGIRLDKVWGEEMWDEKNMGSEDVGCGGGVVWRDVSWEDVGCWYVGWGYVKWGERVSPLDSDSVLLKPTILFILCSEFCRSFLRLFSARRCAALRPHASSELSMLPCLTYTESCLTLLLIRSLSDLSTTTSSGCSSQIFYQGLLQARGDDESNIRVHELTSVKITYNHKQYRKINYITKVTLMYHKQ